MKRFLLPILASFLSFAAYSQQDTARAPLNSPTEPGEDTSRSNVLRKHLYIGFLASPDYTFRMLKNNGSSDQQAYLDSRNNYEIPKMGFTAGIDVLYQFNTRFSLSIGFQYSVKGEKTNAIPVTQVNYNPTTQLPVDSVQGTAKINYNTIYMDLPIKANYYLKEGKWAPYLMLGVSPNLFYKEQQNADVSLNDGTHSNNTSTTNGTYFPVNVQAQAGFGIDYAMAKSRLRIEPVYRISVSKANSSPVSDYFYSVGLNISYLFLSKH